MDNKEEKLHSVYETKSGGLYCGDFTKVSRDVIDNGSVDLTITSPPYDNLKKYDADVVWNFEVFKPIAQELCRITKPGGVVVWVVGDATIKGSETGSSFSQSLYFKEVGFRLHDTMIFKKNSSTYPARRDGVRYTSIFEFMFVFSKGKPKTVNLICDKKNKWAGHNSFDNTLKNPVPEYSPRNNIWEYTTSFNDKTGHPAPFPEQLVADHITSWSNEGDLILDPMCGSGTTCKMAELMDRMWIGVEVSPEYCKILSKRMDNDNSK